MVSLVLSAVKLVSGIGKTSQAQAACWTAPVASVSAGCYTPGDQSASATSTSSSGSTSSGGACGCSCVGVPASGGE